MTAKTADTPDEVAEIMQQAREIEIAGITCTVRRLRTREFFALLQVLVHGLGGGMQVIFDDDDDDPAAFAGRLIGAILSAIPYAEDETIRFLFRMIDTKDASKKDVERLSEALSNPELDDLFQIVTTLVTQEADQIARLGKAARSWWETMGPRLQAKVTGGG